MGQWGNVERGKAYGMGWDYKRFFSETMSMHGCAAQLYLSILPTRHVKFESTGPALGPKMGLAGLLRDMNVILRGSCRAQNEQPNAKRIHRRA